MKLLNKSVENPKSILSTIWIFTTLNYLYADVAGLMDSVLLSQYVSGTVNGIDITSGFLLGSGIFMQVPIGMVLLSRVAKFKWNRRLNIIAGIFMSLAQAGTLLVGKPASYYVFFSVIEISATIFITVYAIKWREAAVHS
jgi:hypothetical protein